MQHLNKINMDVFGDITGHGCCYLLKFFNLTGYGERNDYNSCDWSIFRTKIFLMNDFTCHCNTLDKVIIIHNALLNEYIKTSGYAL